MFWIATVIVVAAFVLAGIAYWQSWNVARGGGQTKQRSAGTLLAITPLEMAVLREHLASARSRLISSPRYSG